MHWTSAIESLTSGHRPIFWKGSAMSQCAVICEDDRTPLRDRISKFVFELGYDDFENMTLT